MNEKPMYNKIIESAIRIFSKYRYDAASMNMICRDAQVSKGILYHYFKDKDALYLECAGLSINDFKAHIEKTLVISGDLTSDLESYFRQRKFHLSKQEAMANLYWRVLMQTPTHLQDVFAQMQEPIETMNREHLRLMLANTKLQDGLSIDAAIDFFNIVAQNTNLDTYNVDDRELKLERMMKIILYGIVGR